MDGDGPFGQLNEVGRAAHEPVIVPLHRRGHVMKVSSGFMIPSLSSGANADEPPSSTVTDMRTRPSPSSMA